MAAPAGLSGSAPEPSDPQTAGLEPVAAESRAATEPMAAEPPTAELPTAELPTAEGPGESTVTVLRPDLDGEPAHAEPGEPAVGARRVRPLAVAAMVLGILALIGAAAAVLAVATHGFRPKAIVTYKPAAVFSLRAGDCVDSAPNGQSYTVLSCARPHDAEVFATFSLAGSSWPGEAVVQQEAGNGCASRIAGYVNPALAEAGFSQEYVYPDQPAWQAGLRTVICEVRASSGQLTGSVRQGS
jgi:Septum formation